jgi:hypothetical protein
MKSDDKTTGLILDTVLGMKKDIVDIKKVQSEHGKILNEHGHHLTAIHAGVIQLEEKTDQINTKVDRNGDRIDQLDAKVDRNMRVRV